MACEYRVLCIRRYLHPATFIACIKCHEYHFRRSLNSGDKKRYEITQNVNVGPGGKAEGNAAGTARCTGVLSNFSM